MTYKLCKYVEKIIAPIIVVIGNDKQEFANGFALSEAHFSRPYIIQSISASDNRVILSLIENENINATNWVGEIQEGFF